MPSGSSAARAAARRRSRCRGPGIRAEAAQMLVVDRSQPLACDEPVQAPVHRAGREPVVPRLDEPWVQDGAPRREDLMQRGLDRAGPRPRAVAAASTGEPSRAHRAALDRSSVRYGLDAPPSPSTVRQMGSSASNIARRWAASGSVANRLRAVMRSIVCDPTRTVSDASPKRWNVRRRSSATSGSSAGPLPVAARPSTGLHLVHPAERGSDRIEQRPLGRRPRPRARRGCASNATPTLAVRAFHAGDVLASMARHDQRPERVAKLSELRLERLELRQTRHAPSIRADHTRGLPAVAPSP